MGVKGLYNLQTSYTVTALQVISISSYQQMLSHQPPTSCFE